jgi:protease I
LIFKNTLIVIPAADFNAEEFLTIKSILVKNGYKISIASDAVNLCVGSGGLRVKADMNLFNVHPNNFAALALTGGNGMRNYWSNEVLRKIVSRFFEQKIPIGAICSAPVILGNAGVLSGIRATCYPTDRKALEITGADYVDQPVVKSGRIVTAQSPQSSLEFSETLIHILES